MALKSLPVASATASTPLKIPLLCVVARCTSKCAIRSALVNLFTKVVGSIAPSSKVPNSSTGHSTEALTRQSGVKLDKIDMIIVNSFSSLLKSFCSFTNAVSARDDSTKTELIKLAPIESQVSKVILS